MYLTDLERLPSTMQLNMVRLFPHYSFYRKAPYWTARILEVIYPHPVPYYFFNLPFIFVCRNCYIGNTPLGISLRANYPQYALVSCLLSRANKIPLVL